MSGEHETHIQFVPMPVAHIEPGKKYLLGVDPDAGYNTPEMMQHILDELNKSFPESRFVLMAGLYSVSEAPGQGD